jgi:multiple sugar transport system substrate-binding protein
MGYKGLSRRNFLKGSAALAALSGLHFTPSLLRLLAQDVTLELLTADWGGNYNDLFELIGADFTEATGIAMNWQFSSEAHTELLTLIGGGTPPDLALTYQPNALAELGAFIPLDDFIAEAGLKREDFPLPMWDQAVYNGQLYALPGGADYIVLFYSKDMYREAGLDPEKPPTTIQEFTDNCSALLRKDDAGNVTHVGYLPEPGSMINWGYLFGGKWYDAENQKITANDPGIVAAFEWVGQLVAEMGYDQWTALRAIPGVFEAGNLFSTNQMGHFFQGFWTYEPLDNHSPDVDYGMALWPTLDGTEEDRNNYVTGGWLFGIPAGAAHPAEAWQFMKFAFVDEAAKMGIDTVNTPAYKPAFPAWEDGLRQVLGADNRMTPYVHLFAETAATANNSWPGIPVSAYYADERDRAFEAVISGTKRAQQACDEMTANVQAELDKALAGS